MISKRVLIISAIIAITIVIYFIDRIKYGKRNVITTNSNYMINKQTFKSDDYILSEDNNGIASTISFWMYVKDWNYKFMEYKNVIRKGKFEVFMPPKNNYLVIEIPTLSGKKESLTFKHVPFQKWLNVTIAIDNRNVDLWINGKLYVSKYLNNVPNIDSDQDLICAENKGYDGYLSKITTWKYVVTKSVAARHFKAGPSDSSYLTKIKKFYDKISDKLFNSSNKKVKCAKR